MQQSFSAFTDQLFASVCGQDSSANALPAFKYRNDRFQPQKWESTLRRLPATENWDAYSLCYESPDHQLRLQLESRVYNEFPVIAWRPELKASGSGTTGVVEDFRSVRMEFSLPDANPLEPYAIRIRSWWGTAGNAMDWQPEEHFLRDRYPADSLRLDTGDGFPSGTWLPVVEVCLDDTHAFYLDIGWLGSWQADFRLKHEGVKRSLEFSVGMRQSHFRLHAGESLFFPTVAFLLCDGMTEQERRAVRQEFFAARRTEELGECAASSHSPLTFSVPGNLSDTAFLAMADIWKKKAVPLEVLAMENGWNGQNTVPQEEYDAFNDGISLEDQGRWEVNRRVHPDRLEPLVRLCHDRGASFLLAVTPELAHRTSPVALQHPEWMLHSRQNPRTCLLNLGRPDVQAYLLEQLKKLVLAEGVDHLCWRMPLNPLGYWKEADGEERQGVTEALYVTGLQNLVLALRKAFPGRMVELEGRRLEWNTVCSTVLWHAVAHGKGGKRFVPAECFCGMNGSSGLLIDPAELEGARRVARAFPKKQEQL